MLAFIRALGTAPRAALLTLALGATAQPLAATTIDGFFPAAGEGDLVLSYAAEGYDEFWVGDTKVSDPGVGEVETTSESLWGRFGLTDDLAVIFNVPYVHADSDGLGGFGDSGFQDLAALLSWRALSRETGSCRHSLALAGGVRTPIESYEANLPVDLGDGSTDALLRLAYQVERGQLYVTQMVGYELRGDDAPDGFPLQTTLGTTFGRVTPSLYYAWYVADGGTDIGDPGFTFPSNKDETTRIGAKIYGRLGEHFGLAVGAFSTLDGRNSGDVEGFSLGAVYRF